MPRLGGNPAQAAALCWRRRKSKLQVLLVKGRKSQRWVLPGGWALRGRPLAITAEREAWEEAGVSGSVGKRALAVVPKRKCYRLAGQIDWQVAIFSLEVGKVSDNYPEAKERERAWFSPEQAAKLVHPKALGPVLREFAAARD